LKTIKHFILLISFVSISAKAEDFLKLDQHQLQKPTLIAQGDVDDTYDPFADYSEFDQDSDEESDIHFFRNGRFFTIGFGFGLRGFTDNLNSLYSSGPTYGLFMSYFFDLRLALQFGFNTGDYAFNLQMPTETITGNVSLTFMHINLKYYFNTQNVTRGLANLNPYMFGGFAQVYRTYTLNNVDGFGRDATTGIDIGAGLEIPLFRKKSFFGIQGAYRYFSFKDEGGPMTINQVPTNAVPSGDSFDFLGILGMNF
jgi:hypothetical protein